jgi:hypothetical protein
MKALLVVWLVCISSIANAKGLGFVTNILGLSVI